MTRIDGQWTVIASDGQELEPSSMGKEKEKVWSSILNRNAASVIVPACCLMLLLCETAGVRERLGE